MSLVDSIESGHLPAEFREALRTLLSQHDLPYVDFPGTDGPTLCISTSLADIRRHIEAAYQERQAARPTIPAQYTISGRRKLPDAQPEYRDVATQTEDPPETIASVAIPRETGSEACG
jgi:hypothetical protein